MILYLFEIVIHSGLIMAMTLQYYKDLHEHQTPAGFLAFSAGEKPAWKSSLEKEIASSPSSANGSWPDPSISMGNFLYLKSLRYNLQFIDLLKYNFENANSFYLGFFSPFLSFPSFLFSFHFQPSRHSEWTVIPSCGPTYRPIIPFSPSFLHFSSFYISGTTMNIPAPELLP